MGKKKNKKKLERKGFIKDPSFSTLVIPLEKMPPFFSFHLIQKDYCISKCERDDKAALADKLRRLSQQTWAEIRQAPRYGLGYEKIKRDSIKTSIPPKINTDDVTFLAFRFSGKKSMVGYRERNIFHIIWLDRDFSVYDHGS